MKLEFKFDKGFEFLSFIPESKEERTQLKKLSEKTSNKTILVYNSTSYNVNNNLVALDYEIINTNEEVPSFRVRKRLEKYPINLI